MLENEKQITVLGENIEKLNNRIKQIQPEYDKSKLFHSQKKLRDCIKISVILPRAII